VGAIAQPTGIAPAPKKNEEVGEPVAGD